MRRILTSAVGAGLMTIVFAGTALGAHCINQSKPDGAGQHAVVLIDPVTGQATFIGANAAGRLKGGFADVYLDLDRSGTLTTGDLLLVNDTFLVANHSGKANPAQGVPAVLPNVLAGHDPAGGEHGVGFDSGG